MSVVELKWSIATTPTSSTVPPSPDMDHSKTIARLGRHKVSDMKDKMSPACSEIARADSRQPDNRRAVLQVPIPLLSSGLVTFSYRRALLNRIKEPRLKDGGRYDLCKYTPVFVHDTLMLPGSLANLIGKGSSEDVLKRMTPALLLGHHVRTSPKSQKPCLVQSMDATSYAQGMVLFGQGKRARQFIHSHYRPQAKRKKVQVEIEVMVLRPCKERRHDWDLWTPQRRTIWVHAWRMAVDVEECASDKGRTTRADWTLEDYLAGTLADELPMRIEASAEGDEEADGYLGRDVLEYDLEVEKPEEREVIHGGPGGLCYGRIKGKKWSGW